MQVVVPVLVYAVLMSFWWVCMKKLTNIGFPMNLIRFASGMGAGLLILLSCVQYGVYPYVVQLPPAFWWALIGTFVVNVIIAYLYLKALGKSTLSVAVHITLFSPIVAMGTSAYVYRIEPVPTGFALGGSGAILLGLYLLHFNPRSKYGWNPVGPFVEIWRNRGNWLWYAVGIAVFAGFSLPLDKQCVVLSNYALAPGLTLFLSWGIVYGLTAVISKDFAKISTFAEHRPVYLLILLGLVFGVANGFQAYAYNYQHAAVVASLKRLDAPFTVLWAWILFPDQEKKDGHILFRILGSAIAFLGAAIIGFSKMPS